MTTQAAVPFDAPFCASPTSPGRNSTCVIFQWIGQSFEHCDGCGRPVREHLYHPTYSGQRPLFRVKVYQPWRYRWVWQPVGSFVNGGLS